MTNDGENGHGYSPVGMFCPAEVCAKTDKNNTTCARQRLTSTRQGIITRSAPVFMAVIRPVTTSFLFIRHKVR
jgi:hypothetical protein